MGDVLTRSNTTLFMNKSFTVPGGIICPRTFINSSVVILPTCSRREKNSSYSGALLN